MDCEVVLPRGWQVEVFVASERFLRLFLIALVRQQSHVVTIQEIDKLCTFCQLQQSDFEHTSPTMTDASFSANVDGTLQPHVCAVHHTVLWC